MISDFINIDKKSKVPVYNQIYNELKNAIENNNIKENEKIPSVRKLCTDLNVSKTTVENAYGRLLADGYIISVPQKGYYVEKGLYIDKSVSKKSENDTTKKHYKYDFSGNGIDKNCSNIKEWRKYVKDVLNKEYLLNTYSENQGEEELRKSISKYAFTTRGVNADYKNIIIGSGSQTLIYILCGMLGLNKTVAIEKNSFPQAEQVFNDFKYKIFYTESDDRGITIQSLNKINPDILILNPNYNSQNGSTMPIARKIEIINWAKNNNCLIIEDDYNGELRYKTHAKACIQSYSSEQVIYIGSFSKILLPSVRISYMVLPDFLIEKYITIKENYNQTTSKIEQLALSKYISDGKLEKYLRKSRRYYLAKSELVLTAIKKYFNSFIFNETAMYIEILIEKDILKKCDESSIKLMNTSTDSVLRLNFSEIESELIEE
ncbi:MAG: PLP-dependent aminotransferase family protein, partial [Ruminococcus sp.]|nr:PLP-dependent aminotransferase family protein [Ruminococcus sp.]